MHFCSFWWALRTRITVQYCRDQNRGKGQIIINARGFNITVRLAFRIEQSPDTNKDELDSAEDTDGGKIDNEEVSEVKILLGQDCSGHDALAT